MSRKNAPMSDEGRANISAAHIGKPSNFKGKRQSAEARAKMSVADKGRVFSLEARAKLSAKHMGVPHPMSLETRAKQSIAHWKGGKAVWKSKDNAARRALGFVPLNRPFTKCQGHHVDKELVIYIPETLHRSIWHRQTDGASMAKINAIAYNFLFKQEAETALGATP